MRRLIAALLSSIVLAVALSAPALAFDPFGGVDCGSGGSSAVCTDKGNNSDPVSSSGGLLANITNIVAIVAGSAALIVLVVGGISYMTAGGDTAKAKSARATVINALIGIAIIALARTLAVYVINHFVD